MNRKAELKSNPVKDRERQARNAATAQARRAARMRARAEAGETSTFKRREREGETPKRPPLKRGRGMAASRAQQAKTKSEATCRVLSRLEDVEVEAWPEDVRTALASWNGPMTLDSAHIACLHGCEEPDATCGLCRPLHLAYDLHQLNLLPFLTRAEEVHAARERGILGALKRITGRDWQPVDGSPAGEDRLPMLDRDQQAEVVAVLGLADALRKLTGVSWEMRPVEVVA